MFFSSKKSFLIIAVLATIGFLAVSAYQIFYKNGKAFSEANTTVKIIGPESLEAGSEADFEIFYKNGSRVNLKNAVLTLNFPEEGFSGIKDKSGFGKIKGSQIVWDMGDVSAGYNGSIKISAKITDANANRVSTSLDYEPENFNSKFSAKNSLSYIVKIAKISVNLYAPKEAISGQEVKYILAYTNSTAIDFEAIRIKFDYPSSFVFSSANPPAAQSPDVWETVNFTRASGGQIEISGVLNSSAEEIKTIVAVIEQKDKDGKFIFNNEISANTNLIASPFVIAQAVNDKENYSADAGETLNYKIKIRNLSNAPQANLIISAALSGDALDFTSLSAEKAVVDRALHEIIWDSGTKSDLAVLDSGKETEIEYNIKINSAVSIADTNSRNFLVKNIVTVKNGNVFNSDGSNKVIISSSFDTKINSMPVLFARGYFNDDDRLNTSGPIPPKVGETTVYNIHWQILNTSNKIKNTKVTGVLPAGAAWTGNIFPQDEKVAYDINTRTITWEAGDIEVGAGILSPLREVLFQISANPALSDVGNYLILIDQNNLTAIDDFTLSDLAAKADGLTTRLPDDLSIGSEEGKVAP